MSKRALYKMLETAAVAVTSICYRRLIARFSGPLQETIACFSGPSNLTFLAKSAIFHFKAKGVENEIFSSCTMFKKVISFIYKKIYFGDRVPLNYSKTTLRKTNVKVISKLLIITTL